MTDKYDEIALLSAALGGCQVAQGDLYDQYVGLIRALCVDATGRLQDADDLSQEVFLRAFKQLSSLRDTSKFGAWLVGIARLTIKEWRRTQWRDFKVQNHRPDQIDSGAESVELSDEFAHLYRLISQLGDKERLALHLFYLQEHPVESARAILGLSRSGFYRVLERAKKKIAGQLNSTIGAGYEPHGR